jgi:hypothetical protein
MSADRQEENADPLARCYEHPLVLPHVSHFKHVPFRTIVKFWHSGQETPS